MEFALTNLALVNILFFAQNLTREMIETRQDILVPIGFFVLGQEFVSLVLVAAILVRLIFCWVVKKTNI